MTPKGVITAELSKGRRGEKKVMVASHERSGTHFLMNTLTSNFGYVANPWINIDYELGINLYSHQSLCFFLMNEMHDAPVMNIVKSHHHIDFFKSILPYLADQFHIFYIYRDPRDVMVSFWRYVRNHTRDEGPRAATVGQFMRAAPWGGMLRYQKKQVTTILERWKAHVQDWTEAADRIASGGIILVHYEELHLDFDATVHRIGQRIGRRCARPVRPAAHLNVVGPGAGGVGVHRDLFGPADYDLISATVGDLMDQLQLP